MTPDTEDGPPKSVHQEILEEEHARTYHAVGVLLICHCIMAIRRNVITKGEFQECIS